MFSQITFQDALIAKLMTAHRKVYKMVFGKAIRQLVKLGYTSEQAYWIAEDAHQMVVLAKECSDDQSNS